MKSIEIKNWEQIKRSWSKAPSVMSDAFTDGIRDVTTKIESKAKRESPVAKIRGGTLRQSIRSYFPSKQVGVITAGAKYAIYVHEGTKPHIIRIKNKKVLANKRTGQIFGKVVRHKGTKANPFFTRAIEKTNYPKIFNAHVTRAIGKIIK